MKSSVREATHTSKKTVEFVRDVTRTGKQAVTGVVTGENPFVNFDDADGDPVSQSLKKAKRKAKFSGYTSPNVRNIDEAMFSLHTLLSEQGRSPFDATNTAKSMEHDDMSKEDDDIDEEDFDWMLDGDPKQKLDERGIEPSTKHDSNSENRMGELVTLPESRDTLPVIISIPGNVVKEAITAFEKLSFFDSELFKLLPTDTSTLEGRFAQRMQEESIEASTMSAKSTTIHIEPSVTQSDTNIKSLFSEDYYNTEYDPIMNLILALPLSIDETVVHDETHQLVGSFQLDILDPFVSDASNQLDRKSAFISTTLNEKINANLNLFYELSSDISVIEHDVSQALLSSKEGSKLLRRTRAKDLDASGGGGILGWEYIAHMSYERDNIKLLNDILESVSSVVALENEITSFFDAMSEETSTFLSTMPQLPKLIEVSMNFRDRAFHSIELMEVQCLNDLRMRASNIMLFLCQRLELCLVNFLSAQCKREFINHYPREWKSETLMEYVNILSARLALEPFVKQESVSLEEPSVHISWTSSILKALTFESHRNLAKALLKPTANATFSKTDTDSLSEISDPILRSIQESVEKYKVDDEHLPFLQADIQNLMTMRFESETGKINLPWVYHQLCGYTAQILNLFYVFNKGHEALDEVLFDSIRSNPDYRGFLFLAEFSKNRAELWQRCEHVLLSFFDMYLASISKSQGQIQSDGGPSFDEKLWCVNMEGLYDVLSMTNHMVALAAEFNGSLNDSQRTGPLLRQKVYDIIRHHLRSFEVDAMTSIGYSLANESWLLCKISLPSDSFASQHERLLHGTAREIQHCYPDVSNDPRIFESPNVRLSDNKFSDERRVNKPLFPSFSSDGNPFMTKRSKDTKKISKETLKLECSSNLLESHCQHLLNMYGCKSLDVIWGTKTSYDSLCKWASRLLYFHRKFPTMTEELVKSACNIFDLYLVTVFRICACDEANANVMLGAAARSGFIMDESHAILVDNVVRDSSAVSRGTATPQRPKEIITKNPPMTEISVKFIEADMVAPQRAETDKRAKFQAFIRRGQESRYKTSNLRKYEVLLTKKFNFIPSDKLPLIDEMKQLTGLLHDRLMSCYSSLVVASFAHVAFALMNDYVKAADVSTFAHVSQKDNKLDSAAAKIKEEISNSIREYANSYLEMAPTLCDLCSRMAAIRVAKAKDVVTAIVKIGPDWNKKSKLHEQSNDYVDILIERICVIWGFMSSWHLKAYPETIIGKSWSLVIESGFLSLLEGFSQISSCSTEGRALMSIDLATFSSGVNRRNVKEKLEAYEETFSSDIPMPPSPTTTRGMQYVDTYIKVFYFPLEVSFALPTSLLFEVVCKVSLISNRFFLGYNEVDREK